MRQPADAMPSSSFSNSHPPCSVMASSGCSMSRTSARKRRAMRGMPSTNIFFRGSSGSWRPAGDDQTHGGPPPTQSHRSIDHSSQSSL